MTATLSKQRLGTLTLGAAPALTVHTQAINIALTRKARGGGDALELVSGEVLSADETVDWTMKIKLLQDFTNSTGVQAYSWANDGIQVAYSWKPNPAGPTYSGTLTITAIDVGGDAGKRLDADVEWTCTAKPVVTYQP